MGSATLTSVRTCTPTPSCPEAPPCTPVSPIVCRRRSPPSLPPPSRSRSSLLPRGSTPSGSEDPSWLPCPPSSRCGSPSRCMTSAAHPLSTASASKKFILLRETLPQHSYSEKSTHYLTYYMFYSLDNSYNYFDFMKYKFYH